LQEAVSSPSSPRSDPAETNAELMKQKRSRTMKREYDFSSGVRGATVTRYRKGTNFMLIDPAVLDVFPDAQAVNEALRAIAPVIRHRRRPRTKKRRV
jgi:hypothetical protein